MDPILKNIMRVGTVSSVDPGKCTARVTFADKAEVVSFDLPVLVRGSLQNKDYWLPDPGEQVVCLFLPSGNAQGFIIGSLYSEKDVPPVGDQNKRHIKFSDGSFIEYDRSEHKLVIDIKGSVEIVATGPVEVVTSDVANVTASTASISAQETVSISAPKGVSISATDITGTGVTITGKNSSEGW